MGVYDTILLPCPKCGELYGAQSKSGECFLNTYTFKNAPKEAMENVNRHAPFTCSKCKTVFYVEFNPEIKIVETDIAPDDFPELSNELSKKEIRKKLEYYYSKLDKK
jgi:hypothetical protein